MVRTRSQSVGKSLQRAPTGWGNFRNMIAPMMEHYKTEASYAKLPKDQQKAFPTLTHRPFAKLEALAAGGAAEQSSRPLNSEAGALNSEAGALNPEAGAMNPEAGALNPETGATCSNPECQRRLKENELRFGQILRIAAPRKELPKNSCPPKLPLWPAM